jgi:hypothetical protein
MAKVHKCLLPGQTTGVATVPPPGAGPSGWALRRWGEQGAGRADIQTAHTVTAQ